MASRKQKKKVSTLFTCNPTNYIIKKKIRRVDFNSSHPDALKCQDPYYDVDTRHLKNAMDLSQELDKPKYKNKPVKSWNLGHRKYLPCEDDDYVRLVNDNFCCETAEQRGKNPLTKEPDYNRKLKERQKAYEDLYVVTPEEQSAAEAAGNKPKSPAQYRRKTVEMNEDLMMN